MDIDTYEVIEAAKTKPFGYQAFYPGPGLGGHCIPLDPFYLSWKAAEYGEWTRFIDLSPGTTEEEVRPLLEATDLRTGDGAAADAPPPERLLPHRRYQPPGGPGGRSRRPPSGGPGAGRSGRDHPRPLPTSPRVLGRPGRGGVRP